jgi:CysZ protein
MIKAGFTQSMQYVPIGWRLLRTPGLRRFVWMPILINLLVFGVFGWWINSLALGWLSSWSFFSSLGDWWIVNAIETVLRWIVSLALLFFTAFLFTLLANLIGAPFNGLLAERVEAHLVGDVNKPAPTVMELIKTVPRLMGSEMAKLIYLALCLVPLLILHFIPVINFIAPALLFLFGAWMFSLEYMDYPMGNNGALFRDVRKRMRLNRKAAYGFGCVVSLFSIIPIVNLFIIPVAVAGATALYVDHIRDQHLDDLN